jgi:hypothetical protein
VTATRDHDKAAAFYVEAGRMLMQVLVRLRLAGQFRGREVMIGVACRIAARTIGGTKDNLAIRAFSR